MHEPGYSDRWFAAIQPWTNAYGDGELGVTRFEVLWSDLLNRGGPSTLIGCIQDFFAYLSDLKVRMAIIARFTQVVRPLIAAGHMIDLLLHSEGTIVGYEGSRQFDNYVGKQILNMFTLGAALCFQYGPFGSDNVRNRLLMANDNGAKPKLVEHWYNLNAAGDPFGGPLVPAYGCDVDYINLPAPGCGLGQWDCAHQSYFDPANLAVCRDILAAKINEA